MSDTVLIVDDDETTLRVLELLLARAGYEVVRAGSAEDGLRKAYRFQPDIVLLDVNMPQMDGWEMCHRLREMSDVPILFLAASASSEDVVRGLELGADDFIAKPFDPQELLARIKAHLRRAPRSAPSEEMAFDDGDFRVNFLNREVYVRDQLCHLTPKEFNLLGILVRNAGRVVAREDLVRQAWGEEYGDAIDSLKLYIHYLRRKLEIDPNHPSYIVTSRGVGYRFMTR
ncbi:MAG: response regulator transcription factor [Chloroflexi bacterium]|jgi:DNA-binding response OmpR family regulator|nr:response regulator transcription factor [Chloroflexota bacterium]